MNYIYGRFGYILPLGFCYRGSEQFGIDSLADCSIGLKQQFFSKVLFDRSVSIPSVLLNQKVCLKERGFLPAFPYQIAYNII